jgi:hypothetical protein
VQVGQEQGARSRPRSLIEAYAFDPAEDAPETVDQPNARQHENPELLSALEFLAACVLPESDVEGGRTPADSGAKSAAAADTDASGRIARRRIPRGLIYWVGVGVSAGATWRLTSSIYEAAVAALVASAALIGLELLLRMVDPRIARRLGFARTHRGATFYGAGTLLGLGTGLAIAHIV